MDRNLVERYRLTLFGRMVMGVAHEVDNHLSVVSVFRVDPADRGEGGKSPGRCRKDPVLRGEDRCDRPAVLQICAPARSIPGTVRPRGDPSRDPPLLTVRPRPQQRDRPPASGNSFGRPSRRPGDLGLGLLALLFNAAEAMSGQGGSFRRDSPGTPPVGIHRERPGTGIPAGFEERVFEVGFTTRSGPFHAGMGLPVARHLAEQAGGTLRLSNGPGGGCVATVRLPMKPRT